MKNKFDGIVMEKTLGMAIDEYSENQSEENLEYLMEEINHDPNSKELLDALEENDNKRLTKKLAGLLKEYKRLQRLRDKL